MKTKILKKSILFTVGVHGNEQIPVEIVKLKLNPSDYLICHQTALQKDIRYFDTDLNRSFPGSIDGTIEEKLANQLVPIIKDKYIIDLHTAKHETNSFVILTKISPEHLSLVNKIGLKKVVIMNQNTGGGKSLIDFAKVGVSIEFGLSKSSKVQQKINQIIDNIKEKTFYFDKYEVYQVFNILKKNNSTELLNKDIHSFKLVKLGDSLTNLGQKAELDFYPIFARGENYPNFLCLMAKKIKLDKNMKSHKKIGIIGGIGANASSFFLQLLINKINQNNLKMPEIILDSVPIDDFISDESKIKNGQKELLKVVKKFNLLKPDIVVMCCNTAHIVYPKINPKAEFNFPSLIDLVKNKITNSPCQNIGILATPNTIKYQLYQNNSKKIFIPDLNLQNILEKNIRLIINSDFEKIDYITLSSKINKFIKSNNLDGIILGCTEIPVFFHKIKLDKNITIFNSSEILADSLISYLQC